ncbi:unnamed protein product [Cuscuta epithymum]|uniref:Uncharacterized protein n=1 Tax=Cuscuta epithymum TaxID=186058 RepID=A0AAV0F9A6_9ASTE|nr:unnamed protein product [Cuscuta epithymum]
MEMAGIEIEGGRLQGIDNHRSEAITMGKFQEQISGEQKDKNEAIDDDEEEAVESEENRIGATTIVVMARPPPEPPPRVDRRVLEFAYLFFLHFNFNVKTFVFGCCFILCCKTFALGLGDERPAVIVVGFNLPKLGLVPALPKVINSGSRPRADGYMWSFRYLSPRLNVILSI